MNKTRRWRRTVVVIACLLSLLPAFAGAVTGQDLFESEVAVTSQQADERTAAMKRALAEVLVRVTGQRELLGQEPAKSMLADPARYVQQYRYYTVPDTRPAQLKMRVRFDGNAVRTALRQQGVTYWGGSERPDTLVWLAVEDRGERYIVAAQDGRTVYQKIRATARQRGVPLIFPLMDLEDQSRARFTDIWGGFFERVLTASERYKPSAILIGRLNRAPSGGWVARWDMRVAGTSSSWSDSDQRLENLLQAGIDNAADRQASRLAVTGPGVNTSGIIITVDEINSLTAYARVNDYLSSLTAVRQFQVERVVGSSVHYAVHLNGTLQGLKQTIVIGTVLEPSPTGTAGSYRLRQ
ncbi:MAG: DUF2066 domain-containing protein [Halobacteria archaeon]|nr:DUF2066 domain-containing protein [Halobacteria archaeon]